MSKKDFELIAQTIKNLDLRRESGGWYDRAYVARQFAIALQHTNARFDVDKFVEVCQE